MGLVARATRAHAPRPASAAEPPCPFRTEPPCAPRPRIRQESILLARLFRLGGGVAAIPKSNEAMGRTTALGESMSKLVSKLAGKCGKANRTHASVAKFHSKLVEATLEMGLPPHVVDRIMQRISPGV
mmetsp:Transcript_33828/g.78114  ORF Transcript_33828/g.78114 Transcript_33828/m.78114 type:complete len:128 (+) Transcript_33828:3-386(+)